MDERRNESPCLEGCTLAEFKGKVDKSISEVGFKQAMQSKWLGMVKGAEPRVERKVDAIEDVARGYLAAVAEGRASEIPQKEGQPNQEEKAGEARGVEDVRHRQRGQVCA